MPSLLFSHKLLFSFSFLVTLKYSSELVLHLLAETLLVLTNILLLILKWLSLLLGAKFFFVNCLCYHFFDYRLCVHFMDYRLFKHLMYDRTLN